MIVNRKSIYRLSLVALIVAGLIACTSPKKEADDFGGESVIVSVYGHALTKKDLDASITQGLNPKDSTIAANAYIQVWLKDELMYEKAKKNIADPEQINKLVDNYRQSLTVFTYQEQLLKEYLSHNMPETDLQAYYDAHPDQFLLENNIVKGLFLKIPATSPQLNNLRKWYRMTDEASIGNIEQASPQNAVIYDYFYNKWVNLDDVMDHIPYHIENGDSFLKTNKFLETTDSTFVYLFNIKEYRLAGTKAPFDYAKGKIKDVLINQKRASILNEIETDLYDKAIKNKDITFFVPTPKNNTSKNK